MSNSPEDKRIYCVYRSSDPDALSNSLSGSSPARAPRLSNKLRDARMKRQFQRSGSLTHDPKQERNYSASDDPQIYETSIRGSIKESPSPTWGKDKEIERRGAPEPYPQSPPITTLNAIDTPKQNTFTSDREIRLLEKKKTKEVYELFKDWEEEHDTGASPDMKPGTMTSIYCTPMQQNLRQKAAKNPSILKTINEIEANLDEADSFLAAAADKFKAKKRARETERNAGFESAPTSTTNRKLSTEGLALQLANKPKVTQSSQHSMIKRVLNLNSKKDASNYTMLF